MSSGGPGAAPADGAKPTANAAAAATAQSHSSPTPASDVALLPGSALPSDGAHDNDSVAVRIALTPKPVKQKSIRVATAAGAAAAISPSDPMKSTLLLAEKAEASSKTRRQLNRRASRVQREGGRGPRGRAAFGSEGEGKYRFRYGRRGERLSLWSSIRQWIQRHWVLNPKGSLRWYWNFAVFCMLIFYIVEIPLRLGFLIDDCNACTTTILHLLCDFAFLYDCLFLQMRTSYYIADLNLTVLEVNPRKIAQRYLRGWFAFDLITSLPVHHVLVHYYDIHDSDNVSISFIVQFSFLIRMLKVFRFVELLHYYHSVELSAGTILADLLKIVKFVFGFFCIAHMSACMWMFIALKERVTPDTLTLQDSKWDFRSWPGNLGYIYPPNVTDIMAEYTDRTSDEAIAVLFDLQTQIRLVSDTEPLTVDLSYLMAMYWSVSTMTTVGFGDIIPRSEVEMAYACVVIFIGAVTFGYITANVSSIIQIDDDADTKIRDKISAINAYMGARKLPADLQKRIRNHFEYTWKRKTVYDEKEILYALPTALRTRVALFLNQDLIRNVAFLRDLGSDCLALLVTELRPFRVGAGYWIFKQNSLGREMNFVAEGIVEVLGKKNKQLTVLSRGAYFGEMALLSERPTKRSASVRALVATDLFALTKASFDSVLRIYPELKEEVQAHAEARLAEAIQGKEERDYTQLPPMPNIILPTASAAFNAATAGGPSAAVSPSPKRSSRSLQPPVTPMFSGGGGVAHRHSLGSPGLGPIPGTPKSALGRTLPGMGLGTPRPRMNSSASPLSAPPSSSASTHQAVVPRGVVATLGFNPYLSLPNSRMEGEKNEVELRRTVLRGKEELELIMHPELRYEIEVDTAEQIAALDAQVQAEKEFLAIAGGTVAAQAAAEAAASEAHLVAALPPQRNSPAHTPKTARRAQRAGVQTAFAPLELGPGITDQPPSLPPLPLQLGTHGSAFMSQLAGSVRQALQPLQHAQHTLSQMQQSALQQQQDLDQLVADLDL